MRIVVLDGYTLNPGDLSWSDLESLGDCTIHDRTQAAETLARAKDAEIVLTNKTELPRAVIEQLPRLKYIGVLATGYNVVDVTAATEREILLANVPAYGTMSVAQMVFAHLLHLTQHVADHGRTVREGRWSASDDFCYWDTPLIELDGLVMGIVGFGRIGRAVSEFAKVFGMRVLAHDLVMLSPMPDGVEAIMDLERLFRESDVVSLHCPLTGNNRHLVNRKMLSVMKPSAFLINTSRGPLVDERALAEALNAGRLAGAGVDVLEIEPPPAGNPLFTAKNCTITPHISWATRAARRRLLHGVVENVRAYLAGRPQNIVNSPVQ